jgi:hypothetical protein
MKEFVPFLGKTELTYVRYSTLNRLMKFVCKVTCTFVVRRTALGGRLRLALGSTTGLLGLRCCCRQGLAMGLGHYRPQKGQLLFVRANADVHTITYRALIIVLVIIPIVVPVEEGMTYPVLMSELVCSVITV